MVSAVESAINCALPAVLKATMSVRRAAGEYGILRTILVDRLVALDCPDYVRKISNELVDAEIDCVKFGFSAHRAVNQNLRKARHAFEWVHGTAQQLRLVSTKRWTVTLGGLLVT